MAAAKRRIDFVVLHHWGGPPPASREVAHKAFVSRGYSGIAYNAIVTASGDVWVGRPESERSAATYGLNERSVAICLLGNFDRGNEGGERGRPPRPTDAQIGAAGRELLGMLRRYPGAKFIQHRDAARITLNPQIATACPGELAVQDHAARAIFLVASGYRVPEARRRAAAGR
jgi:hypothetical protein